MARKAKRAAKAGDLHNAYAYFAQASALQPHNKGYRTQMAAAQTAGGVSISTGVAPAPFVLSSDDAFDSINAREFANGRQLASPPRLNATPGKFNFNLNDQPRVLFNTVAAKFNLQAVFDGEYPPSATPVRFDVDAMNYRDALTALQAATGSFIIPISPRVFMVARDTAQKRTELEQTVMLTIPVPDASSLQELTEAVQLVRQATNVEKIAWDSAQNQIVIRDQVSRAAAAQALLAQLVAWQPQVMIDVEMLQVNDTDISKYGFTVTANYPLVYLGGVLRNAATVPTGVTSLLAFGGGRTLVGIAAAEVQSLFNETISTGRAVYSAQVRAGNGVAGTFHVGEKYPIITGGFINAGASAGNPNFVTTPAVSYEDLGLEIKLTPRIHPEFSGDGGSVTLEVDANYETLTGQSADGIPVIARNHLTSDVRLRNEEWAVVGGMMGKSDSKARTGFGGLMNIPLLGNFFKSVSTDNESSSLLIGIRPHIVSLPPGDRVTKGMHVGSDAHPYIPL